MRIIVSGGGSAGHISPTLATSDALKSLDKSAELLYIGQAGGMEGRIVGATGLAFAGIRAGKFRRAYSARVLSQVMNLSTLGPNMRDVLRVVQGLAGALQLLRKFKPDVVFLKGGYVCLPVGLAARVLRIPYVIHESDLSPGLANRILAKWAEQIAVGFPVKQYADWPRERLVFTGNPVRPEIMNATREDGMRTFELAQNRPVVLVTGGSQGAREINEVVLEALPELLRNYQVIHQTGEGEYERILFELKRQPRQSGMEYYHPYAFILKDMAAALAVADVVVSRAGANVIAELAVLGKPAVLIPNMVMAGHQMANAKLVARAGAARVVSGERVRAALLAGEIDRILHDREERARLSSAIRQFGRPNAAEELARVILSVGKSAGQSGEVDQTESGELP